VDDARRTERPGCHSESGKSEYLALSARSKVPDTTTKLPYAKVYVMWSYLCLALPLQHIFNKKSRLKKSTLKISFSYVEILVEEVYDLLVVRKPGEVSLTCSSVSTTYDKLVCIQRLTNGTYDNVPARSVRRL
jgi:hypothetical protein